MRRIEKIVIHCSDSPDDLDIGAKNIKAWHTDPPPKGNGWSDIGYHLIVRRNGRVELGRPIELPGAHVRGHNSDSVGICWVGRRSPTPKQYKSLLDLATGVMRHFKLPFDSIFGHTELDPNKTCPNIDMNRFRGDVLFNDDIPEEIENAITMANRSEDGQEECESDPSDD